MTVSRVETLVLGLLAERQSYGYELLERCRERSMSSWVDVGRASVYQVLGRLESKGFVAGRMQDSDDGPDRRVYRLTRTGRSRLDEALSSSFGRRGGYETDAGTALAFIGSLSASKRRSAIEARQTAVSDILDHVRSERAGQPDPNTDALLARQEALAAAELEWIRRYRSKLIR